MKIIIVPDEGEWVLVPKVATEEMVEAVRTHSFADRCLDGDIQSALGSALAAAPPCKVVELPERATTGDWDSMRLVDRAEGVNWVLDEIERRAK